MTVDQYVEPLRHFALAEQDLPLTRFGNVAQQGDPLQDRVFQLVEAARRPEHRLD